MKKLILLIAAFVISPHLSADITNKAVLEAYIDGVMHASIEEHKVAGAVVTIVTPDEILVNKGYGYANVDAEQPVNPDTTLFRIGSVSKLLVWLPIMQLLEQGKLDLDTDINEYLGDVQIPATQEHPITIKHLMTHTPGFEDHVIGLFGRDEASMKPLAEILEAEMPKRVREPGTYASYSNHGVGMAGLIIENSTGQTWPEYVDEHVLNPLGMVNTSAHQPLPDRLSAQMSNGYRWHQGSFESQGFEYVPLGPAGGVSASGGDMAIFLQQFLKLGEHNGARVLSEATSRQMQTVLHRPAQGANGLLHGFYETSSHGQRIFGHGGDTIWFHSEFMLMPEAGIGFFISTNSEAGPAVRSDFRSALLDRYFPKAEAAELSFEPVDRNRIVGTYAWLRYAHDDLTKLAKLFAIVNVSLDPEGNLVMSSPLSGPDPAVLEEVATGVFKQPGKPLKVTFDLTDSQANHLYIDSAPIIAFERVGFINSPVFAQLLFIAVMISTLWVLVVWTVQNKTSNWWHSEPVARFRRMAYLFTLTNLIFLIGLAMTVTDQTTIVFGLTASVKFVILIGYLVALLALVMLWRARALFIASDLGTISKVGYAFVLISALTWAWYLFYMRLLFW